MKFPSEKFLTIVFLCILCSICDAQTMIGGRRGKDWDIDLLRPKTVSHILRSYRMVIDRHDGINDNEARIIAQYELVRAGFDSGYSVGKPRLLDETSSQWLVVFPSKFSLTQWPAQDFLVCVDKEQGRVTCFGENSASGNDNENEKTIFRAE